MAVRPSPRSAEQVAKAILEKSKSVRDFATELSDRIIEFQQYLAQLPGRVEAATWARHPAAGDEAEHALGDLMFGISLSREGKEWVLLCAECYADDDRPTKWKPLHEASLKLKMASIKLFPNLLEAIEKSQDALVAEIMAALGEYDLFASALKKPASDGQEGR